LDRQIFVRLISNNVNSLQYSTNCENYRNSSSVTRQWVKNGSQNNQPPFSPHNQPTDAAGAGTVCNLQYNCHMAPVLRLSET